MREHVVDESDMATEREMMDTQLAIQAALRKVTPLPPMGFCYNCEEPLSDGKRFCDVHCRDDWEIRNDVS